MKTRRKGKSKEEIAASQAFAAAVLLDDEGQPVPCIRCGAKGARDAHHAVPEQVLRKIAEWDLRMSPVEALQVIYAPEVGVSLCSAWTPNRCHERQTSMTDWVPGHLLPGRVFEFAESLGETALRALETQHPGAVSLPVDEGDRR